MLSSKPDRALINVFLCGFFICDCVRQSHVLLKNPTSPSSASNARRDARRAAELGVASCPLAKMTSWTSTVIGNELNKHYESRPF